MNILIAQLHNLTGGTQSSRRLFQLGLDEAIKAFNSSIFIDAVYGYEWTDPETGHNRKNFHKNVCSYTDINSGSSVSKEMTRQQVHSLIMSGWDKFHQIQDGDIDVDATLFYKRWSSAIGYTYPSTFKTWLNTKFWTGSEKDIVSMIAGNIAHEYMHNLGFGHAYDWNSSREFTVPYAIGTIINQIVKGEFKPGPKEYKKVCSRSWKTLWIKKTCRWVEK